MVSVTILGVTIEKRKPHELIQPEDFNRKKEILLKIMDEVDRIVEEVGGVSSDVEERINKIKSDVNALPKVYYGDMVFADHHNDIVDVLKEIADLLQDLPKEKIVEKPVPEMKPSLEIYAPKEPDIPLAPKTTVSLEVTTS